MISQVARIINKQSAGTPRPMPTPRLFLDPGLVADGDVAAGVDDALVTVMNTLILETWLEPVVLVTLDPYGIGGATVTTAGCNVTGEFDVGRRFGNVNTGGCGVTGKGCVVTTAGCDVIIPRELDLIDYSN